jgi:lipoyl(octanoyl) transferase
MIDLISLGRIFIFESKEYMSSICLTMRHPFRFTLSYTEKPPQPVLAPNGAPIYRIERGGEVTFHGPGQLIVYPLLDLRCKPYQQDLHWYLRSVEEVIIQTLGEYGIEGVRDDINTGKFLFEIGVRSTMSSRNLACINGHGNHPL